MARRVALERRRIVTSSPSARSSLARTCPRWSTPSTRLPPAITTPRLVVAGPDGWGAEAFDAAVARARHRSRIIRLGWVDDQARADLLAGAIVFAYPSKYEGFGLPPLEAMAAGTPVVATTAGALPEVVGDAARLVPPGDADALAGALQACWTTAWCGTTARTAGRERARRYLVGRDRRGCCGPLPAPLLRLPRCAPWSPESAASSAATCSNISTPRATPSTGCDREDGSIDIERSRLHRFDPSGLPSRGRVPPGRLERRRRLVGRAAGDLPSERRGHPQPAAGVQGRRHRARAGRFAAPTSTASCPTTSCRSTKPHRCAP